MIRHDFQTQHLCLMLIAYLTNDVLEAFGYLLYKYLAPVFRTPDEVILQTENSPGVAPVSRFSGHAACYTSAGYLATSFCVAAIPPLPEGSGFPRRPL